MPTSNTDNYPTDIAVEQPRNPALPIKPYQGDWNQIAGPTYNSDIYSNADVDNMFTKSATAFNWPPDMPNGVSIDQGT